MTIMDASPSTFLFTYAAALDDGSLYVSGVARELEDRDVPHTILWERVGGAWRRYQWKNRTYGVAAYQNGGAGSAIYLGYEGTAKVRNPIFGSSEEQLEGGDDAPSSLRTVSAIRVIGDWLFVAGMRRMVYGRSLVDSRWERVDNGVRLDRADLKLAGFYAIDGPAPDCIYAAGIGGEVWKRAGGVWTQFDSPTNLTMLSLRCLDGKRFVAGGEGGALWLFDDGAWIEVSHQFPDETFSCIEAWHERCFVSSEAGAVFELLIGRVPQLRKLEVPDMPSVSWVGSSPTRAWFIGGNSVKSLSDAGWKDESPPNDLLA